MIGKIYGRIEPEPDAKYKFCAVISNVIIESVICLILLSILFVFSGVNSEFLCKIYTMEYKCFIVLILAAYVMRFIYARANKVCVSVAGRKRK